MSLQYSIRRLIYNVLNSRIIRTFKRNIINKVYYVARYLNWHLTPLGIMLLSLLGSILIYIYESVCRYRNYDYWLWRKRAFIHIVLYCLSLVLLKAFLMGIVK